MIPYPYHKNYVGEKFQDIVYHKRSIPIFKKATVKVSHLKGVCVRVCA